MTSAPPPVNASSTPAVAAERPPARLGLIGFWLLIFSFVLVIAEFVGSYAAIGLLMGDSTGVEISAPDYSWISWVSIVVGALRWAALLAATVLGILGLVKRERKRGWSIVAAAAIPIHFILYGIGQVIVFIVVIAALAIG